MENTASRSGRAGGRGRWRAPTRGDVLTFLIAAMLCSASYWLGIWHNSRGAADSRVLGPAAGTSYCGGDARPADADKPLDFEAHHAAETAGLSVSSSGAATRTPSVRRALSSTGVAPASRAVARTGSSVSGAEAAAASKW